MKSRPEAIAALTQFGYTPREAEFLYIVAVHSGFFVQRQFMQFVDVAGRGPATYFLKKAIQKKHVREHLPDRGTQKIYHLFSRSIYAALGNENSRHRKQGRYGLLEKAAVRVLGLDFVLSHLDCQFLEEDTDKVSYFAEEKHVSVDALPAKIFRGQTGAETRRYFVEKFPIVVSGDASASPTNFTYIEDDIRSLQTFAAFIQRYQALFGSLGGSFKVTFVSTSTKSFSSAREVFTRAFSGTGREREQRHLVTFFKLRKMAEEKRFKELAHRDVIEWQRGLKRYSDAKYESQYQSWKQTGKLPEIDCGSEISNPGEHFETFLVAPNLGRFAPSAVGEAAQSSAQLPEQERSA
ncbi:MAG TPA: hypothetical protein VKQ11_16460 [Candidatus Sulfotelmatobacter sp.]|nr:hypothetical protein [Candidatus Sulfotelmatobacter sp.]